MIKDFIKIVKSRDAKIICQGMTGKNGTFHTKNMLNFGSKIVAGVNPLKGGEMHLGLPVYNSVNLAKKETGANISVIFVPAIFALSAITEAIVAEIKLIVCITEGIPDHDMLKIKELLNNHDCLFIGPNCPGFLIPGVINIGIMPSSIYKVPDKMGGIAIFSRSGTLCYEAVKQTSDNNLTQSICIGMGGDLLKGINFIDGITIAENLMSSAIIFIGEIGGNDEEKLAKFLLERNIKIPIFAYIAGEQAPMGQKMGHAGAIIGDEKKETAFAKKKILKQSGVHIIESPLNIGKYVKFILEK